MTMHLVGPYLTTTGKRKGKHKFRNSSEAQKARQLEQDWENLKKKWDVPQKAKKQQSTVAVTLPTQAGPHIRDTGPRPASLNSWHQGAVSTKNIPTYTGGNMLGITIVHKSCLQPIFTKQEAVDAATMRR